MSDNKLDKFLEDYTNKIQEILKMPSGLHPPDKERLSTWVNAQASQRRRNAAKALADNIIYITHAEVIQASQDLIQMIYEKPVKANVTWFIRGGTGGSNYFMALLCYHFAEMRGFKLPSQIIFDIPKGINYSDTTIMYLDDMSYSGSQASSMSKRVSSILENSRNHPPINDIRFGFTFITESALIRLSKASIYTIHTPNIITNLSTLLAPQLYVDCLIYFANAGDATNEPPCICYFDHKLADSPSTFLNLLMTGPVPPANVDWTKSDYVAIIDNIINGIPIKELMNQNEETIDKDQEEIQFIPFITACGIPQAIQKIIEKHRAKGYMKLMDIIQGELDEDPRIRCPDSWYKGYFKTAKGGRRLRKKTQRKRRQTPMNRRR